MLFGFPPCHEANHLWDPAGRSRLYYWPRALLISFNGSALSLLAIWQTSPISVAMNRYNHTILLKAEGNVFTHQHVVIVVIHWCNDCKFCVHQVIWKACLSGCGMFWTLCWRVDFVLASNRSQRNTSPSGGGKSPSWRMIYKEGANLSSSLQSSGFHPHSPVTPSDRGIHSQVSHLTAVCVCVCGL